MANKSYSKNDLSRSASQVKRQILNKVRKGSKAKFTKTEAFNLVAKSLKLSSSRTLWLGEAKCYLDEWFLGVKAGIEQIQNDSNPKHSIDAIPCPIDEPKIDNLSKRLSFQASLLKEYEKAIKVLREENERLRLLVIDKHGKIDI